MSAILKMIILKVYISSIINSILSQLILFQNNSIYCCCRIRTKRNKKFMAQNIHDEGI